MFAPASRLRSPDRISRVRLDEVSELTPPVPVGQLRWRARRGQRELDLILSRWLDARYSRASIEERRAFAALLECPDPDILDWVLGRAVPPAELSHVVSALTARD